MRELISPNVTRIKHTGVKYPNQHPTCIVHPNGVYEIDTLVNAMPGENFNIVEGLFRDYQDAGHLYDVSVTGLKTSDNARVGSQRFCTMDRALAQQITDVVNNLGILQQIVKTAADNCRFVEEFIGCSSYFRFMRYTKGGEHFPHYDSDFQFVNDPMVYTRFTVVAYFTNNVTGEIAFVNDPRENHGNTDWDRQATNEEITLKIAPKRGKIVIFPHDLPHTVLPYEGKLEGDSIFNAADDGVRMIARGDLVFGMQTYL